VITANPAPEAGHRPAAGASPARATPVRRRKKKQLLPYLLLLPVLAAELLIHIIPMFIGVGMSFLKLTQFYIRNWTGAPAAGLSNYGFVLQFDQASGKALLHSFWTTVQFTVIVLALSWAIAMAAAIWTQHAFRGRGLVRTAFLVPYALPVFASVITWSFMLQRDNGMVNHVLVDQLHLTDERPFWLIGGHSFWALIVVEVWRLWPFAFLALTAGMSSIPAEQYEAAAIDGAGVLRSVRFVTLPNLRSVNQVLLLVLFLWTFNEFTVPYTFFGKSAPEQADLISMHIYQNSFVTWNFGTGSAMSVLLLLFLLLVTAVYLLLTRKKDVDA
jgi:multiple sugar transport system permease protein